MNVRCVLIVGSVILLAGAGAWYFKAENGTTTNQSVNNNLNAVATNASNVNVTTRTCTPTAQLTEGPYYKAGSPARTEIREEGTPGFTITLTGKVLDTNCQPIIGADLDFWQADGNGNYDNSGFTLRGHQTTDATGAYILYTVIPGQYPGRTEHIHVKVRRPGGQFVTSQLFFPGVARNETDSIYDQSLLVTMFADENLATYDFILE